MSVETIPQGRLMLRQTSITTKSKRIRPQSISVPLDAAIEFSWRPFGPGRGGLVGETVVRMACATMIQRGTRVRGVTVAKEYHVARSVYQSILHSSQP